MIFYSPFFLFFLISIIPLILLYILKQKFLPQSVSSLYLWKGAIKNNMAVNPWQKLKNNTLLILELLILILLAVSLGEPYLKGLGKDVQNNIILIDNSMSMRAKDVLPSRIELAKLKAIDLIKGFKPGNKTTIISVAGNLKIETENEINKNNCIKKIEQINPTYEKADFLAVSNLVEAILKENPNTGVYIYSDGFVNFPGIDAKSQVINAKGENYSIQNLSHSFNKGNISSVSSVSNFSRENVHLPISLYADNQVVDARIIDLTGNETKNVYWRNIPQNAKLIEARIDVEDNLSGDNKVYDVISGGKPIKAILFSKQNVFIKKIFSVFKDVELYVRDVGEKEMTGEYDLFIYDGTYPQSLPAKGNIILINPPKNPLFKVNGEIKPGDVEKGEHPLSRYLDDVSFLVHKAANVELPIWSKPVLFTKEGVLVFSGEFNGKKITVFTFDIHNSDMPLKTIFPVFFGNIINYMKEYPQFVEEKVFSGKTINLTYNPEVLGIKVTRPDSRIEEVLIKDTSLFKNTDVTGFYKIEELKEKKSDIFFTAVNPVEIEESDLTPKTLFGETSANTANAINSITPDYNLKVIFLIIILILLAIEWWVFVYVS